jgi:hypothetical protein
MIIVLDLLLTIFYCRTINWSLTYYYILIFWKRSKIFLNKLIEKIVFIFVLTIELHYNSKIKDVNLNIKGEWLILNWFIFKNRLWIIWWSVPG